MATTTTNFGWDIPQSTDLVKDGATAIAALGQDIDTAFVDFKGGTTGQVLKKTSGTDLDVEWGTASSGLTLINSTSFSAVSSQSLNNVFSSTYDNYQIVLRLVGTTSIALRARLRVSGSDNSTASSYTSQEVRGSSTTAAAFQTIDSFFQIGYASDEPSNFNLTFFKPFVAVKTSFIGLGGRLDRMAAINGFHNQTTSYDGITIIPESSTITGDISVYGLAK
jgi:hypothetical protein